MRYIAIAVLLCISIATLLTSAQNNCVNSTCALQGPSYPSELVTETLGDSNYILDVVETVTTIGTNLWEFIDNPENPYQIIESLNATLTPSLTYLVGINDSLLQPYYPEIYDLIEGVINLQYYISDPEQLADNLVDLLFRAANLSIEIIDQVVNTNGDPQIDEIFYLVESILSDPNVRSNITCVLEEVFSDPSVQELFGYLTVLQGLTYDMSIVRPILEVFSRSYLFESKFQELFYLIPNSDAFNLCADASLANLVCPFQPRYCQSICAETLEYCTAILSQSLQDLSDVLDSVMILTAGYINSQQFETEFYQIRQTVLYVVENSLMIVSNFDINSFVNQTIENCDFLPLVVDIFNQLGMFGPNETITEEILRMVIYSSLDGLDLNATIDVPSIIYTIENAININDLRSLASQISNVQNGYILDGVLSLGISNLLRFSPPFGCGEQIDYYSAPLSFPQYYPYYPYSGNMTCYDGSNMNNTGGGSNYYYNNCGTPYGQCSFSYYGIFNNQAAQRTCSFTYQNFLNAKINTSTNLCTIFESLPPESTAILLESVMNYGRLPYCRDFIMVEPPITCVSNNCTINGPPFLYVVVDDTVSGAEYVLSVAETVTTIGSSVWDFIDETPTTSSISELLNATLTPSLTYLAGVNDTLLQPFYPQIFYIIDQFFYLIQQNISDPEQLAYDLVNLLFSAANLAIDIVDQVVNTNGDSQIDEILYLVETILSDPYLRSNVTCVLEEVFSDPSVQELFGYLTLFQDLTPNMGIVRPILEVFSRSYLFTSKFQELFYLIPNSYALTLCVDAVLANLVCPFESRYCDSLCGETLEYCTAVLSQSVQDLSDVLDSVVILTVGYINSQQFETEFYQIRQTVLYVVENSLMIVSNFDINSFVTQTIENCDLLPLVVDILNQVGIFGPNQTITEEIVRMQIYYFLGGLDLNATIDIPSIIYTIENAFQIDSLRNLTSQIYYTPNGFILDALLSLGISNLLRSRPPLGCGERSYYYQSPLSFPQYSPFFSNCFDGSLTTGGSNSSYYYSSCGAYSTQCSFSYNDLYNNRAAERTCSFTQQNFYNARINTSTNLCTVFESLSPNSTTILLQSVRNYGKLSYCRDFIVEPPITCVSNNCTIYGPPFLYVVVDDTVSGAEYVLSVAETVTTIGSSVWDFIDETPTTSSISELLNATLTPSLTYLAGVNDTLLQPFYPQIFYIIDQFFYLIQQNISDPEQLAYDLVNLLFSAANLAIDIVDQVVNTNGDSQIDEILYLVETILSDPYLRSNVTCVLEEVFSDPSVQELFGYLTLFQDLTPNMGIVRPILEVFSRSYLFTSKFQELFYLIPNSYALTLCVDAVLANLVCPFESRYCDSLCGETLEYCTAVLSQSVQDLSDVLDSVVILTVGYINSQQFETEFYQIRQTVLYVVENSLMIVSNFDINSFVTQTIENCDLLPLVVDILNQVGIFGPNQTITEEIVRMQIYYFLGGLDLNATIDIPSVIYTIENALQIDSLRNLTSQIYYIPNGFILDSLLSLGISNLLRSRPPLGCGERSYYYQSSLSFPQYYPFFSNCFDGSLTTGGSNSNYYYSSCGAYSTQCSFSYNDLYNNRAAERTCSFTQENFYNARINTSTNLCTVFESLSPNSTTILLQSVRNYGKLSYCRDFIVEPPITCVSNNCTINGPPFLYVVVDDTVSGAEYVLSVAETVTIIGSSVWDFIDETPTTSSISELLNATLTPSLTYLAGVNDTLLQPFYPQIFYIIDQFFYLIQQSISDPEQLAYDLVNLLFSAANLAIDIVDQVVNTNGDSQIDEILYLVETILSDPYLRSNVTCVLEEVFSDPSVQELFGYLTLFQDLTPNMTIVRPILQVFSRSYLFTSKFQELFYLIPDSDALTLCVDAVLANLVCPFESRYCDSLCGETLEYCTAILSQSVQDLSDVLDSVVILTVGYINSQQFETEFYQIRQTVLYVVENSLITVSNFDVLGLINQTIENCDFLPLVVDILNQVGIFGPNQTITEEIVRMEIYYFLDGLDLNATIDIPSVIYTIENAFQIDSLRNLTSQIYYTPNGFILDSLLSLGISNLLRSRPPLGCGERSYYYQSPLSFPQYYPFFSNCFDGSLTTGGSNSNYYYSSCGAYSTQCSFSYNDLYNNRAAERTCSFTQENFYNARINTSTNLCTVFESLSPNSTIILLQSVRNYGKLSYCRDFIVEPPITCVSSNCTIYGPPFLYVVVDDTVIGAEYILSVAETVTTIGSSVWDFIDETPTTSSIGELLNATLTPSLTYLAGVNDTLLQPFYPELFYIVDQFFYFLRQDFSDPQQQAYNLAELLFRAANLAINITRVVSDDSQTNEILYYVESILSDPYLRSNVTCVLEEVFSDPSVQELLGNLTLFQELTPNMTIVLPILQVFSRSYLFTSKFQELFYLIPDSYALTLCVDAVLANLVCPFESRYCDSLCGETLEYCTAVLSQSLQDLSDVLDSVVILTVGYINSEQFETEFYQIRQTVLYVVENSLMIVSNFDINSFVNQTIENCNFLPLVVDILNRVVTNGPNQTITEEIVRMDIYYFLGGLDLNATIDIPSVIYTIENAFQIDSLRNLTSQIYYTPNGFILDSLLSLGISNLLRSRPPLGCGERSYYYQSPLSFPQYYPFFSNCFDGSLTIGGSNSNYYYSSCGAYSTQCSFSYNDLYNNRAAERTCSFTQENFYNARINTSTNLCTVFSSLYPESISILIYSIQSYNKLSFCRDYIILPDVCVSNQCTMSPEIRSGVLPEVVYGSEYVLDVTQTVTIIGTSLWEFIDDIEDPNEIGEFLNATLTPALTYLAGINDTILQPLYPQIFEFIDDLVLFLQRDFSADPQQNAEDFFNLTVRGLMLAFEVASTVGGDYIDVGPFSEIIYLPGFRENVTCILSRLFANEDFGRIVGNIRRLENIIYTLSGPRPILQVFSQISLFQSKFEELRNSIPTSAGVSLCLDAVLTNIVCPMQSQYCQALCADTLVYCTALLSQSLQDLSDVLDSVAFLAVNYIVSDQFEVEFNAFKSELLFVVNDTLQVVSGIDIIGFVNETIQECNFLPLILEIWTRIGINPGVTPYMLQQQIITQLNQALSNFTIEIQPILYSIQNELQIDYIRNLSLIVGSLPNGFLLDGVLSLGVMDLLRLNPPLGCGQSAGYQYPLLFEEFYTFNTDCFDGNNVVSFDPRSTSFGFFDFSLNGLLSNMAATRTCSFSTDSFVNSTIITPTNLCTLFLNLYPDSRQALQNIVTNYPTRLPFCREFILAEVIEPPTVSAPTVSFPQENVSSIVGQLFEYPCTVVGVNSSVTLSSSNSSFLEQQFGQSPNGDQFILSFTPTAAGVYEFQCSATNEGGSNSVTLTLNVRTVAEVAEFINNIPLNVPIAVELAQELISILTSAITSNLSNNTEEAIRLFTLADLTLDSLTEGRFVSIGEAEGLLLLFEDIGETTTTNDITETPPANAINVPLAVPLGLQRQALALERVGLNLLSRLMAGEPVIIIQTQDSILSVQAVTASGNDPINVGFGTNSEASVNFRGSFPDGATVGISSSVIRSELAVDTSSTNFQPTLNGQLASELINLNIMVDGVVRTDFSDSPPSLIFTVPVNFIFAFDCQSIDEEVGIFVGGDDIETVLTGDVVVCRPEHLTSFGVLVRSQDIDIPFAETLALSIVSYLLLIISLIFLIASIVLFLISAEKFFKVETNILYFNYAFSLTLATSVFIFGIQTAKDSPAGCSIVTFLLHYFWLSVFSWSFAISVFMIYILFFGVVQRRRIWWLMMLLGWGLPLPIVIITAAVGLSRGVEGYVTIGDHCFISYQDGLIWGFFVPFILLVVATTILAVITVIKIFLSVRGKGEQIDEFEAVKKTALTVIVLLPVLSAPWILGIINAFITSFVATTFIEWVTILLTAPTGVLFFFLVVVRNAQVQEVVFRMKPLLPTTASQTSSTTASKFTMPQKAKQDATLQRDEPSAITNPAYEATSKAPEVTKDAVTENLYATPQQTSQGKSYQSIEPEDDSKPPEDEYKPPESPSKKYSQIEKHDD